MRHSCFPMLPTLHITNESHAIVIERNAIKAPREAAWWHSSSPMFSTVRVTIHSQVISVVWSASETADTNMRSPALRWIVHTITIRGTIFDVAKPVLRLEPSVAVDREEDDEFKDTQLRSTDANCVV